MDVLPKAKRSRAWRLCARVAVALCLVVFGVGDAVERGFAGHGAIATALSVAVSMEQSASASDHSGIHVDGTAGDVDRGDLVVGHGCHGCAALAQPLLQTSAPIVLGSSLPWSSVPSAVGREPLIDLPPPRA